ncbi:signal recognition particle-docking protein FtsY [Desulfatitalea tepidiphila]|uniref:signal recognition particle-docking protein FtsY n=1 Tax=Desulfatitalea tepidiphila TaxID=1185843 RepID=UPI000975ACBB|nr:signal recognition particle-docking protein FtsY [Desulfatitalea tepidiphila]
MAFWFKKKNKPDAPAKAESTSADKDGTAHDSGIGPPDDTDESEPLDPSARAMDDGRKKLEKSAPSSERTTEEKSGFFLRLKRGLTKTREILTTDIQDIFAGKRQIDEEMLEEIEELLITSDIGVQTTMALMNDISRKAHKIATPGQLKETIKQSILSLMESAVPQASREHHAKPHVIMVVGVNGVGKTTTIGKLASREIRKGQKVLIAAADTFRAAAVEQLAIWAERAGADFVRHKDNADPAAVAYDGIEAALARGIDTVFVDTAGRLHTKINLMEELKKIQRTISKKIPDAPHEILLVLDATTGQNALSQAKLFHESMGITGLALTKLDGTAKGGIVISICQQLKLPLLYVGVGEGIDDLQPFDAKQFVDALF